MVSKAAGRSRRQRHEIWHEPNKVIINKVIVYI